VIKIRNNQATGYASQHIWCLSQARINWKGCVRKGVWCRNGGMTEVGAPISLDGVAVHPDCWCICLCYLHFAPENPEDGEMYTFWYQLTRVVLDKVQRAVKWLCICERSATAHRGYTLGATFDIYDCLVSSTSPSVTAPHLCVSIQLWCNCAIVLAEKALR